MTNWPPPLYEIRTTFSAPVPFAFRWCTDFSSRDPELEKGKYQRKVVEKTRERVVFEDLYPTKTGWQWYRVVDTLFPPGRWHAELGGNIPDWNLDHQLTSIGRDRTTLSIRWHIRQRPAVPGYRNPSRATAEGMMN